MNTITNRLRASRSGRAAAAPANSLFAYRLLRATSARRSGAEGGSMMAVVVLALLVLLLGAAALASRMSFSWLGSIGQSDYRAAKEAAEYGFSEVIARLNTNRSGHLYVTKWRADVPDWRALSISDLTNCNIAVDATTSTNNTTIVGTKPISNNNNFNVEYQLMSYTPPATTRTVTPDQPFVCSSVSSPFGNLFGGSATVRIEGRARRASGALATYTLERKIHVGSVAGNRAAANTSLALLCNAGSLGNAALWFDRNKSGLLDNTSPADEPLAILCDGTCSITGNPSGTPLRPNLNLETPSLPVKPPELAGVTPLNVAFTSAGTTINNYPYLNEVLPTGTVTNSILRSECRLNPAGDRISCVANNLYNTHLRVFTSNTTPPVNIFLEGSIAYDEASKSNLTGQGSQSISGISNLGLRSSPSTLIASGDPRYRLWSRVRLFGSPTPVVGGQFLNVRNSDRLDGLFAWMPNGTFLNAAGNSNTFGVFWVCGYQSQSAANKIVGPLNPENTDELEALLRDILDGGTDPNTGQPEGGSGAIGATSSTYRSSGG